MSHYLIVNKSVCICNRGLCGDTVCATFPAARALSEVKGVGEFPSYSGFFTVNETYGSNMFFWFFPAQVCIFVHANEII